MIKYPIITVKCWLWNNMEFSVMEPFNIFMFFLIIFYFISYWFVLFWVFWFTHNTESYNFSKTYTHTSKYVYVSTKTWANFQLITFVNQQLSFWKTASTTCSCWAIQGQMLSVQMPHTFPSLNCTGRMETACENKLGFQLSQGEERVAVCICSPHCSICWQFT